jgi:hypothetical protein
MNRSQPTEATMNPYRVEDTGEGAWTLYSNEPTRTAAGAAQDVGEPGTGRVVEVFVGGEAQSHAETACRILNEEAPRSEQGLRFPAYRIVTHYQGNTSGWPVTADRVVDALADRLSKIGDIDLEEAESEARLLLARVDGNGGCELGSDVGDGRLWLTAVDPATGEGRDTLGSIGVTSFSWPV